MDIPCVDLEEKRKSKIKKCRLVFAVFFLVAVGFGGGWWMHDLNHRYPSSQSEGIVRENSSKYHFINPLLECEIGADVISQNRPKPSKERLQNMISNIEMQERASFISVYYRDLNNGPWIGIHQNEPFYPASLLKVPVMMYYYKQAESNPSILNQKIVIATSNAPTAADVYYRPEQVLEQGKEYTVDELIQHMIIYSDNEAAQALMSLAQPVDPIEKVFQDIGLQKDAASTSTQINITDYALLLRVLFNASYLNSDSSERALSFLSQTKFTQGLTGELPDGLTVSHKFGERESDDGTRQLHDCGIVYKTNFPYLVCIMTRGKDIGILSGVIQDLSKEVYDEISENRWKP
jgi:beta-lactamase class A